ncbi:Uncharacterised protein [Slackia heliotrinireducens]|uniref:Uncharacterized protein n=1 Tax=Slackia heliotrinireducens (strain ATCC 29202 / DSM 20476 / NCTC 11029 / RHS 1) TaxID=471855 RepID=C7N2Q6_SLAHD|nr:hypothetical protein [Slackia heliotrinireducens]ACV23564.1 hypothetical protein Shel_25570 [Slackia heliotrinireducens DSM 20476]VEH02996.1 Uncharacterised protein [Slackia heliotrinireducens]
MALDKKGSRFALKVRTKRGPQLDGVLFCDTAEPADTVLIAITGIHGNFYSNRFYVTFGEALNSGGFDFVYAGQRGRSLLSRGAPEPRRLYGLPQIHWLPDEDAFQ